MGDAKLVTSEKSFYIPGSQRADLAVIAQAKMDRTLLRMADAAEALHGPRAVEIVTNSAASAAAWEARMTALGVPGYVRLQP